MKVSDLPAPVGSTAKTSRDERHALITSRCSGRKLVCPKRAAISSRTRPSHSNDPAQSVGGRAGGAPPTSAIAAAASDSAAA
eukprot:scaffold5713_cov124-Isochrysis_galbana.AAC.3